MIKLDPPSAWATRCPAPTVSEACRKETPKQYKASYNYVCGGAAATLPQKNAHHGARSELQLTLLKAFLGFVLRSVLDQNVAEIHNPAHQRCRLEDQGAGCRADLPRRR